MSASFDQHSTCPQCGAALPAEATEGLCPRCLLSQAMHTPPATKAVLAPRRAAVSEPEDLAPHFPSYEILRMLGRGGMGAVYLARQISLNRLVAIKILPAELDDADMNFAERFKNEAQAMAQLSHPGIVAVFDFGQTASGLLYIVMEYVEGTDVQLMIARQGRLHSEHAMAVTAHVCDALAYAHARGIIHRDIKPSNIMISHEGVVKVADFGLAKMSQGQSTGLTQSGMAMGTLHFMAPEALTLGTGVDQRADIYAVGVMLYQMLTGKLPQGLFEMPSFQVPGLDPRYDNIVAKALREDREVRYQQAAELRHDLDAILTQPVVKVEPKAEKAPAALPPARQPQAGPYRPPQTQFAAQAPKKSSPLPWVALIALAGATGWFFMNRPRQVADSSVQEVATVQVAAARPEIPQVKNADAAPMTPVTSKPSTPPPEPVIQAPGPDMIQVASATKDKPFINSLGMKFVPVSIKGGPTAGKRVLFSIWETRVQDFQAFAKDAGHPWKADARALATHPAAVNWKDTATFCQWLTEHERKLGIIPESLRYRVTTDHEWSCAVGIEDQESADGTPLPAGHPIRNAYPWGNTWPPPPQAGNFKGEEASGRLGNAVVTGYRDDFLDFSPAGSFPANVFGLYDLAGNAWELCEREIDSTEGAVFIRGGSSANSHPVDLASNRRVSKDRDNRSEFYGFRIVLAPAPPPPAAATKDAPFVNTLGMKFVPLPGTKALMSIHETRNTDYAAFATAVPAAGSRWKRAAADSHPAVNVSWEEAAAFCAWLSKKENRRYRLPKDREWSIAVQIDMREAATATPQKLGGTLPGAYPWGTPWPPPGKAGNYAGSADGFATTAPVMSFAPNALGFFDLGGNVWEFCADGFNEPGQTRVLRGASWSDAEQAALLSSCRDPIDPSARSSFVGFRCVLEGEALNPATPVSLPAPATNVQPPTNTIRSLRPDKIKYSNKAGVVVDRFAWKGKYTAVLSESGLLDAAMMTRLVGDYDRVYEYYSDITGREPRKPADVGQLAVTAEDDTSSTNWSVGATGTAKIWVKSGAFQSLCKSLAERQEYSVTWFREFGLNTWYYAQQISPSGPAYMDAFPSGYCIVMRAMAARRLGLKLTPPRGGEPEWDKALSMLLDLYLADSSLSFANTIATNQAPANSSNLGAAELFAAICLRLCDDHGGDAFLTKLWQEVGKAQPAKTAQDCTDTFILAASAAADKDLSTLFTTQWRWPMSSSAMAKATKRWKKS